MISARAGRTPVQSDLQVESERLRRLLTRHFTIQLNRLFDLSNAGIARRRLRVLSYVLVFAAIAFAVHIVLQLPFLLPLGAGTGLDALLPMAFLTGLRIILIVSIAASVGLHAAGRFLADIFEVRDARVAWRHMGNLAMGSGDESIQLREGHIREAERNSPIVQIGGPGRVFVDYETAALFERPDGTPHVVGSADGGGNGGGSAAAGWLLEGFERLREPVISLRDQYIGNPSSEPLTVVGRSLDGMPISVTDVRGVFSIRREPTMSGLQPRAAQLPFPFRARDIESLIYSQTVPVLAAGEHASGLPGDWTAAMNVLIRDSLREFMSQNRLSEFLASIGAHEAERSEFRADTILSKTLQVASDAPEPGLPAAIAAPRFHPRTELSNKFKKYGSEFSTKALDQGLELHWIGVGTWKMPDESSEAAMSGKHVEAWRLNRENAQRSNSRALEQVAENSMLQNKLHLIQDVPIGRHERNQARYTDKAVLMECLLQDFWDQLGDALDLHYRTGTTSQDLTQLEAAVLKVEELLRVSQIGHVIGGGTTSRVRKQAEGKVGADAPPAPASKAEAAKYQLLLGKLQGDYRVAEAMILNEKRRHGELNREQLIARIIERFERHGR